MSRVLLALLVLLSLAAPAQAHKLKVFATVRDNVIVGYAFFVGGGRAQGTDWVATNADGVELAHGRTGPDGAYRIDLPEVVQSAITISVDTHEGHVASTTLPVERFGLVAAASTSQVVPEAPTALSSNGPDVQFAPGATEAAVLASMVAEAVQRQVEPLQEQIAEMDSRLRFSDIVSAICVIFGLAGIGLYVRRRRA